MKTNKAVNLIMIVIVLLFLLFEMFPIVWIILNSFKNYKDIVFFPPKLFFVPTFENYINAFQKNNFLFSMLDSIIIALSSVCISVFVGCMTAYGIVRLKVGGSKLLFFTVSSRMIPPILFLLPMFIIFSRLKIMDTYFVLILVYSTLLLSFVVWQMSSFLKDIPIEIEEAAIVDGCSKWGVFFRIILPISRPGLTAVGIFAFLFAWNDYIFASILGG